MKFNTAISFIACSVALISTLYEKKKTSIILGSFVLLVATLSMLEYLTGIQYGIDELIVKDLFDPSNPYPGRMAPSSSIAFILSGLLIILINTFSTNNIKTFITLFICFGVFALGNTGLIAHIYGVEALYSWRNKAQMSPHTALCFIIFSIGIFAFTYKKYIKNFSSKKIILPELLSSVLPLIAFLLLSTSSFILYDRLRSKELGYIRTLGEQNSEKISTLLNSQIDSTLSALNRMAKRWDAANGTPIDVWNVDADNYIRNLNGLKKLAWIDEKYDLRWIHTMKEGTKTDQINSTYYKKYIDKLKKSELSYESTMLVNNDTFTTFIPLKTDNGFNGFLVGIFSLKDLFKEILTTDINKNYDIYIEYNGINRFYNNTISTAYDPKWRIKQKIQIYNQEWSLFTIPTLASVESLQTSLPITILISSLIIASLSSISIWFILIVRAKSDYLKQSNQQIKDYAQKLSNSEERYDLAVQGMSVGLWDWNILTGEIYWSDKFKEIIGINKYFKANSDEFFKRIHPEDKDRVEKMLHDHINGKAPYDIEYQLKHENGQYIWIHTSGQAKWGSDGKAIHMSGSADDISERKRIEIERAKLISVVEESVDYVGIADLKGHLEYHNRSARRMIGLPDDYDLSKLKISDMHPKWAIDLIEKEAIPTVLQHGNWQGETALLHKNGTEIPVLQNLSVHRDSKGNPICLTTIMRDISERKKYEQALKTSEETFRSAIENASIGMALVSKDGRFMKVNKSLCDLLGYSSDELLNIDFQSITDPQDLSKDLEYVKDMLAEKIKDYHMEKRYYSKNGNSIWALLSVSMVRDSKGEPDYFISQIQDITERKEVDRLKGEFISTVSHELRTPLTSIRGSLGLIIGTLSQGLSDKVMNLLKIAYNNCERLIPLINDILDLDKISSGKMHFDIKQESLANITKQAVDSNQSYADKFGVSIKLKPIDQGIVIAVDAARYIQILSNLISNAAKFSPEGKTIDVFTTKSEDHIKIYVKDYGSGIPEEFRSKIFGKFCQADSSSSRSKSGTGLGLHITKMMTENMGGNIGFDTKIDEGTTFWIEFPICIKIDNNTLKYL